MVQRPKLNSTCKMTTAGWDPGGARRDMGDLKARSKGKKKQMKTWPPCNQHRFKEDQMEDREKQHLRDKY